VEKKIFFMIVLKVLYRDGGTLLEHRKMAVVVDQRWTAEDAVVR
jgi:hypothetical protein